MKTTDICDKHENSIRICLPELKHFGGKTEFHGKVETVTTLEDNSRVKELLQTPGHGRVLVVDGQGSLNCALMGDNLGLMALQNGWAGLVIHGCIRDSEALASLQLGVCALATHPRRSKKEGKGTVGEKVHFLGVEFQSGDFLYADADGIVVSNAEIL